MDDVEEHKGSLEVHADPEERREEEGVFPWGEEVLEDVRDKVILVILEELKQGLLQVMAWDKNSQEGQFITGLDAERVIVNEMRKKVT